MKKNYIRQMFALLLVALFTGQVNAQEVVFNFNEMDLDMSWGQTKDKDTGEILEEASTAGDILEAWSKTIDGVTITVSPKTSGNENRFWRFNGVPQLRCYSGTITISASQNIAAVEFGVNANNFNLTPNVGGVSGYTWGGKSAEIIFTVNGNTQLNSITVTLGDNGQEPEVINVGTADQPITTARAMEIIAGGNIPTTPAYVSGKIASIKEVSIDNGNATFWITDDGNATTAETDMLQLYRVKYLNNQKFTEDNLNVGDDVIVCGKLQNYKGNTPEIGSDGYIYSHNGNTGSTTPVDPTTVTIADLVNMTEAATNLNVTLNNAKVVYKYDTSSNQNVFVREGDNAINFYSTGLDLPLNATISGTVNLDFKQYYGMNEVVKNANTNADNLTITAATSEKYDPVNATVSEILNGKYKNDLVLLTGVTVVKEETTNDNGNTQTNYYVADASGNQLAIYGGTEVIKENVDEIINLIAVFNSYRNQAPAIRPVQIDNGEVGPVDIPVAGNIARLKTMEADQEVKLMLEDAFVLYISGKEMYVRDASNEAICFYGMSDNFKVGDLLNGSVTAKYIIYKGMHELTAQNSTNFSLDDVTVTANNTPQPKEMTLDEISAYECDLVVVNNMTLELQEDGTLLGYTDDAEAVVYDKFKLNFTYEEGKAYNVTGIVIPFMKSEEEGIVYQLCPTEEFSGIEKEKATFVKTTTIEAGKRYLLAAEVENEDGSKTLKVAKPVSGNYGYLAVNDFEVKNTLTNIETENALTMVADASTGYYRIQQSDNRYYWMDESHNSFQVEAAPNAGFYWDIQANGDGTFTITNVDRNKYVQFSITHNSFGSYPEAQENAVMPMLYVEGEAGATAISNVNAEMNADAPVYNLAGQRVARAEKGIFIQNGKKVIMK